MADYIFLIQENKTKQNKQTNKNLYLEYMLLPHPRYQTYEYCREAFPSFLIQVTEGKVPNKSKCFNYKEQFS